MTLNHPMWHRPQLGTGHSRKTSFKFGL